MPDRKSILLAAVVVLGLAAYLLWFSPGPDTGDVPREASAEPTGDSDLPVQSVEPDGADEPGQLARRARQLGESRQSELRDLAVSRERFPHDVRMDDYKAALWSEIQANPPKFERPGDPALDAETAYRLYMYYGMCSTTPRTGGQIDRGLERLAEQAGRAGGRHLRGLESRADQMVDMFELCLDIPPDVDCRMEAVIWMTEAVRLGHEIAQVQFYEKVMGFLLRPDRYFDTPPLVLLHPGLIQDFKTTARFALKAAMEKGHPEAFLAMSRAVFDGVAFPRDPVEALAYARAAELEAMENGMILRNLSEQKYAISQSLDPEQVAAAEDLAHRIRTSGDGA